jgi:hypothetical protein
MASYYKQINNVKYDRGLLDLADQLTQSERDGRISKADGAALAEARYDGGKSTKIENKTVAKIRREYNFTDAGADSFERTSRSIAQQNRRAREKAASKMSAAE